MTNSMDAIRQTFFQECEEQLTDLEAGLIAIGDGTADPDSINAVFRSVHSIKGGAGAFQLADLVSFAHGFESVLDELRTGRLQVQPDLIGLMLRASDTLTDLVRAAREGLPSGTAWQGLLRELDAVIQNPGVSLGVPADSTDDNSFTPVALQFSFGANRSEDDADGLTVSFRPHRSLFANANDPIPVLRELARLGDAEVSCSLSRLPLLDELDPDESYLAWSIEVHGSTESAVRECFEFVDGDCDLDVTVRRPSEAGMPYSSLDLVIQPAVDIAGVVPASLPSSAEVEGVPPAPPPAATTAASEPTPSPTIRVDLDRVDRLINLVGELVINQAMLVQQMGEAGIVGRPAVATGLDELKHLTRDIQEGVMAIRAQPVKPLFQRMGRIVREVASATGKTVRLKTEGEGTEVDKTVIERLADPLTHLIRNAIDHGIEAPDHRLAANKPAEGTVQLTAAHRSGRVVIEITDDGAGIDRARVRETAERKGLIPADAALTDSEIDNLLFLPGFSTAKTVSDISGRGVGMDVVKRSIQALGGRVTVGSRPSQGSTFTLSLPLTLAVLDGMVVSVAGQTLVIPLTSVIETLRPRPGDIHQMGAGARVLAIRESFVPLLDVGVEMGFASSAVEAGTRDDRQIVVLVETSEGTRSALVVNAIQDQRQVVIKSLEANYGHVPGVAAATILGDGRVALILDVDALLTKAPGELMPPHSLQPDNPLIQTGLST